MNTLVGAFNQEKALVGAFSVIVQLHRLIDLRHYNIPMSFDGIDPECWLVAAADEPRVKGGRQCAVRVTARQQLAQYLGHKGRVI